MKDTSGVCQGARVGAVRGGGGRGVCVICRPFWFTTTTTTPSHPIQMEGGGVASQPCPWTATAGIQSSFIPRP